MDLNCFGKGWFAIQVRPRYEFVTSRLLRGKGYEEFLPVYSEKRQWSDRKKNIEMPLFTGYVFCRMDPDVRSPIVTTPGVIRIVGNSKGIARIDDAEIVAIQAAIRAGVKARPCDYVRIGDRVSIGRGPLAGVEGILSSYGNNHCLVLSVSLIQSSVAVEIMLEDIAAVNGTPFDKWHEHVLSQGQSVAPALAATA